MTCKLSPRRVTSRPEAEVVVFKVSEKKWKIFYFA